MPRLPFIDPDPDPAPLATEPPREKPWPVAVLAAAIKAALTDSLPRRVRVVGEVSNLSDRNHWFFSLKDDAACIRCVMFASAARAVRFPVTDGLEVVATGRVDFYDGQGAVQLYIDKLEPVGQGARELELRRLTEELRGLGYFDLERKRPLPLLPRTVAVVTSRSAAALQDVIDTAARRWPGCRLLLFDVRVQGADAAPQVAAALRTLSRDGAALGVDAVILTRGGGSIEDLWAFNERAVVEAIVACNLPIVAAIGHETDTTLAELVADVRCATPTQAAMTLIPDAAVMHDQLEQAQRRLRLALHRHAERARQRLDAAARHPVMRQPQRLVDRDEHRLDLAADRLHRALPRRVAPMREHLARLSQRLHASPARRVDAARQRLVASTRTLDAVAPQRVLERGYTYTLGPDGRPLASAPAAVAANTLTTVFADGRVTSTVESGATPPRRPRRAKPRTGPGADEPTLFA